MPDAAYASTRRRGEQVTVVRALSTTTNPETGARDIQTEVHNVRLAVRENTSYGRIIKAKQAQVDVGGTTFIFWTNDITFRHLDTEDYVISRGQKFQVVSNSLEGTSFVVTAKHVVGTVGKQEISIDAGNDMGLGNTAEQP